MIRAILANVSLGCLLFLSLVTGHQIAVTFLWENKDATPPSYFEIDFCKTVLAFDLGPGQTRFKHKFADIDHLRSCQSVTLRWSNSKKRFRLTLLPGDIRSGQRAVEFKLENNKQARLLGLKRRNNSI